MTVFAYAYVCTMYVFKHVICMSECMYVVMSMLTHACMIACTCVIIL